MYEIVVWACVVCGLPMVVASIWQGGLALLRRPGPEDRWDVSGWTLTGLGRIASDRLSADSCP